MDTLLACLGFKAQFHVPEMEREDESLYQNQDNERRSRSGESQREGNKDGPKYWREASWKMEPFHGQQAEEGPGREGQVSLMAERDQLSLILDVSWAHLRTSEVGDTLVAQCKSGRKIRERELSSF